MKVISIILAQAGYSGEREFLPYVCKWLIFVFRTRITLDMPMGMVGMADREVESRTISEPCWCGGHD